MPEEEETIDLDFVPVEETVDLHAEFSQETEKQSYVESEETQKVSEEQGPNDEGHPPEGFQEDTIEEFEEDNAASTSIVRRPALMQLRVNRQPQTTMTQFYDYPVLERKNKKRHKAI